MAVLGSQGIVVKYMAFFAPIGCVRFARYCGKMYGVSSRLLAMLGSQGIVVKHMAFSSRLLAMLGSQGIVVKYMAFFAPIGYVRFARYCGKIYGFFRACWLLGSQGIVVKYIALAMLGSQGIVVKYMAFFAPIGCVRFARYCGKTYGFLCAYWLRFARYCGKMYSRHLFC